MSVTSVFSPVTGQLTIFGDATNNGVVIGRDKSGRILVNNGSVKTAGGDPIVANTNEIDVFGQGGDDTITVNRSNGPMPAVHVFGGDGNDKITGGSGADLLFGQAGDDTIKGGGGNDLLFGGAGNDTLDGGSGDNQLFGGLATTSWSGISAAAPICSRVVTASTRRRSTAAMTPRRSRSWRTARVRFDGAGAAPFSLDIGTTENLVLHAGDGDDVITAGNGLAPLISLTLDGGAGNDRITGGDGNDLLIGGSGDDLVNGGRGNDVAQLGSGDDTFIWNPGDGSDTVEGGSGNDKLLFNGANINEKIDISANGGRVRFTRDVANITMDLNSVEQIEFDARGGADNINVGDLTGTGVKQVLVDLGATPGARKATARPIQ